MEVVRFFRSEIQIKENLQCHIFKIKITIFRLEKERKDLKISTWMQVATTIDREES